MTVIDNISLQGSLSLSNHILSGFNNNAWGYKDVTINLPNYTTWEAGCKFTTASISSTRTILNTLRATGQGNSCGFGIYIYDGDLFFAVPLGSNNSPRITLTTPISENATYVVTAKFTGSAYELYVNGVLEASTSNSSKGLYNSNYNNKLYLGQYRDTADASMPFFDGSIDLTGCYFIADNELLWQGVERSKQYNMPARKGASDLMKFFYPCRKRAETIVNSSLLTANDATISSSNILTTNGTTYSRARTTERLPIDTADNWEWRTKFTYVNSGKYSGIIAHDGYQHRHAPYVQILNGEAGYSNRSIGLVIPTSSSSHITPADNYSKVINANTPYYLKFGFTGSEYYLELNTEGWDAQFTRYYTLSTQTKCFVGSTTKTEFMNRYTNNGTNGNMDLNETRLFINGDVYWEYITNKIVNDYYIPTRKDNS